MKDEKNEYPNYWGIIPASVRYDQNLSCMQKIIFAEISALQNLNGVCFATNNYFSKIYDVHKNTVGKWINELEKKGYIKSKLIYKNNTKQVEKRLLFLCIDPINQNIDTYQRKDGYPINEKIEDNNINTNSKTTTTILEKKETVELINRDIAFEYFTSYGFDSSEFKYEFERFKILNDKNKQTVKNWKRWCIQLKKFNSNWNSKV